jgi:uncharacterized protein YdaU (DUF1376 family)
LSLAYFPLYPTDFDADTGHLTMAEDGAYNRLLRLSWRCPEAKMPDDLDWICRKARAMTPEDRALIQAVLSEFFTRKGGKVFSKRLAEEYEKAHEAHAKRISAGSQGGKAKALKHKATKPSIAVAIPYQPEPEPEPEPEEDFFGSKEPQKARVAERQEDDGFEDFWKAYPRKEAKAAARKNWAKAIKKAPASVIIAAAERYAQRPVESVKFLKFPQGWLTDERWRDEEQETPDRRARFQPPSHEEVFR